MELYIFGLGNRVKFQVFKDGKPMEDFTPAGAYMFGPDGIALRRCRIRFKNGVLECEKAGSESAGVALLWPVDGFGKVLLPTTCLPERKRPYVLNVELVRAKLMQIINMREEWSFFNNIGNLEELSKKSQGLFIEAIQNILKPARAAELADRCLEKAVPFSEGLAVKQADSLLAARVRDHGFSRGCLGCAMEAGKLDDRSYLDRLLEFFGFITIPINWAKIERQKDNYDFSSVEACLKVLSKKRVAVGAGPLLHFRKDHIPAWLLRSGAGFEKIRESAYRFVSKIISEYSSSIFAWRVVSGLNAWNYFGFSFEEVLEMTRAATMAAKAASERAVKVVEIHNPWGEYFSTRANTIPPLVYIDMIIQSGINFDAFGLPVYMGKADEGMHVRDMMQISAVLDYFRVVGKPLYITEVEVPSEPGDSQESEKAGFWHGAWDQTRQKQWIEQFFRIALSKPFVETVTYSSLRDGCGKIDSSGLLTSDLEPKKSFRALKKFHGTVFGR